MYSKVIVPLDGSDFSEQALPYAQLVAKSMSVPIELVEAYDILPPAVRDRYTPYIVRMMLEEAQQRSEKYLSPIQERLEAAGHTVAVSTLQGMPADAIVALAGADSDALVVMSTHGRSGVARWVLGSVADKVLHTVPNPLLIVRVGTASPAVPETSLKTVLVPLDGSTLAELSLPHAVRMATALGAGISLLRVTPTLVHYRLHVGSAEALLNAPWEAGRLSAEELVASESEEVAAYLSGVKDRLEADHVHGVTTAHRLDQNVAQVIIDKAREEQSLVVMTTHGRSGVGRLALGSVADKVVRHASAPVLVIRQ